MDYLENSWERLINEPQFGSAIGNLCAGLEKIYDKTGTEVQKGFKSKTPALVYLLCGWFWVVVVAFRQSEHLFLTDDKILTG